MWCPKCRAEYVKGMNECPRCYTLLTERLPVKDKYEELMETRNPVDVSLIKDALDSAGISYYFKGELFNVVQPWTDPSRLMVRDDQMERAKAVLGNMRLGRWNTPPTQDTKGADAQSQAS